MSTEVLVQSIDAAQKIIADAQAQVIRLTPAMMKLERARTHLNLEILQLIADPEMAVQL